MHNLYYKKRTTDCANVGRSCFRSTLRIEYCEGVPFAGDGSFGETHQ